MESLAGSCSLLAFASRLYALAVLTGLGLTLGKEALDWMYHISCAVQEH